MLYKVTLVTINEQYIEANEVEEADALFWKDWYPESYEDCKRQSVKISSIEYPHKYAEVEHPVLSYVINHK